MNRNIALLVIDMQTVYLKEVADRGHVAQAVEYINYVSDILRSGGQPVIHIQDVDGMTEENASQYEFIPEIKIAPDETIVRKMHSNAFWETNLEEILKERNVGFVIAAGFAAEHCVLFTFNGARERGFPSVILHNGIASSNSDAISSTYRDRSIVSYSAIQFMVDSLKGDSE